MSSDVAFTGRPSDFGRVIDGNGADLASAATAYPLIDLLAEYGAVLLRNFRDAVEGFEALTDRLGRVRPANIRSGTVRRFETAKGTQAVNVGSMAVAMHAESYYTPICPQILAFICVTNTATGGETIVCDGRELYRTLPDKAREALDASDIVWRHECSVADLEAQTQQPLARFLRWCERVGRCTATVDQQAATVSIVYTAPAIRRMWWRDEPAFANNLIPIYEAGLLGEAAPGVPADVVRTAAARAEELAIDHRWQPGEVMLVDNTRVIHGRLPFSGGERHLRVRMLTVEDDVD